MGQTTGKLITAADLFCGAGGTSSGLLAACEAAGYSLDLLAINHWQVAIGTHSKNHVYAKHLCEDLDSVNPRKIVPSGHLDLLVASPECTHHSVARGGKPINDQSRATAWHVLRWAEALRIDNILIENVPEFCFPVETAVLSKRGLIPIGDLEVGDEVWTHNARWKPVVAISRRRAPTVRIKGYGNSIVETTPNHQFYARQYAPRITQSGKYGRHEARLLEPEWVRADELANRDCSSVYTEQYSGYAWATPKELPRYWMRMPVTLGVDVTAPAFFYMLGRWLGDGWFKKRTHRQDLVRICAKKSEADELGARLAETGLMWHRSSHTETVDVFDLSAEASRVLIRWISANFGEYAYGKTLPTWVFGATDEQKWALIEGYLDADGHEQDGGKVASVSVSRCLAVGLRLLLQSLGVAASISRTEGGQTNSINNPERTMSCREAFSVSWRRETDWEKCERTELHLWGRVREVEPCRENVEVVDITVADDHSFIADGQVVHNCTWGPLRADGKPMQARKGEIYIAYLNALHACGYNVDTRILNAADYGDATTRRRLFIMAKRRGKVVWPEPTHAPRASADLFGSRKVWRAAREIIDWNLPSQSIFKRKKPLSDNTLRRIAAGLHKFGGKGFIVPFFGERPGQDPRSHSVEDPLPAVTSHGAGGLVEPFLVIPRGQSEVRSIHEPTPTITNSGAHLGVVEPFLVRYNGSHAGEEDGDRRTHSVDDPVPTLDTSNRYGVCEPFLIQMEHSKREGIRRLDEPMPTVTSADAFGLAEPFLVKFFGTGRPASVEDPLDTVTAKDRFGLVIPDGYTLDIRFRMLQPKELSRAQGFPAGYEFTGTREQVVKQIGNAVPVNLARALCCALLGIDHRQLEAVA